MLGACNAADLIIPAKKANVNDGSVVRFILQNQRGKSQVRNLAEPFDFNSNLCYFAHPLGPRNRAVKTGMLRGEGDLDVDCPTVHLD